MQNQTFFIPVSSKSLAHYFGRGIILPSSFYDNKPADIQDRTPNAIFLSRQKWLSNEECAIEIILADAEVQYLTVLDNDIQLYLYPRPVPISRVAAVYFTDENQSEITQWNINNGTAYLPKRLIKIEPGYLNRIQMPDLYPEYTAKDDFRDIAKRFDIILGGIAFINVAKPQSLPFAKDYLSIVSHFNSLIKSDFQKAVSAGFATFNDRLTGLLKKENQWSEIQPLFTQDVTMESVEQMAHKTNVALKQQFGLLDLKPLAKHPNLYLLALMATYGLNKAKSESDLITDVIAQEQDEQKAEEIAFIFGMHIRYSRLRNSYGLDSSMPIKFALQTKLDYYIIESVYQFVFGVKSLGELLYLNAVLPQIEIPQDHTTNGFFILDTFVAAQERVKKEVSLPGTNNPSPSQYDKLLDEAIHKLTNFTNQELIRNARNYLNPAIKLIVAKYQTEIDDLRREVKYLKSNAVSTQQAIPLLKQSESSPNEMSPQEGIYDNMDMKELKALAKSLKIRKPVLDGIKPTKLGFERIIRLITNNKPLL